jgi:hypothetical protein
MNMKDTELRGILLQKFYDRRREGRTSLNYLELSDDIRADAGRICAQLAENDLITWHPVHLRGSRHHDGMGEITARGIEVVEGETKPAVPVQIDQSHHYTFTDSHHNIVGDRNVQLANLTLAELTRQIDKAEVAVSEKNEAKNLLQQFLEHPLVCALAGGLASTVR